MMTATQIRLKTITYRKLKQIAEKQERSINKQMSFIIEQYIKDYEKVNGEIKVETEDI